MTTKPEYDTGRKIAEGMIDHARNLAEIKAAAEINEELLTDGKRMLASYQQLVDRRQGMHDVISEYLANTTPEASQ